MKFTATLAVASLLSAVFVSAAPITSEFQSEVDAREFSNEDILVERATLGRAIRKAAKDTADIAAQKIYDVGTSGGSRPGGPGPFSALKKPSGARPRPGGVRPIKAPGGAIKAPSKPGVNWKGAWDAGKGKKPASGGRKPRPVIGRPPKSVPRPGGHAGKPVRMPKKSRK